MNVKKQLPGTISLIVNTFELKEWIDKNINLSPEVGNWSVAYNICRCFPGLQNAEKLAEYVLETIRNSSENEEGKTIYEEIDADTIIDVVCRIYNLVKVAND